MGRRRLLTLLATTALATGGVATAAGAAPLDEPVQAGDDAVGTVTVEADSEGVTVTAEPGEVAAEQGVTTDATVSVTPDEGPSVETRDTTADDGEESGTPAAADAPAARTSAASTGQVRPAAVPDDTPPARSEQRPAGLFAGSPLDAGSGGGAPAVTAPPPEPEIAAPEVAPPAAPVSDVVAAAPAPPPDASTAPAATGLKIFATMLLAAALGLWDRARRLGAAR